MQTTAFHYCTGNVYILQPANNNRKKIFKILVKFVLPVMLGHLHCLQQSFSNLHAAYTAEACGLLTWRRLMLFLQKDPSYVHALPLLSEKLSVNFLTRNIALPVFLCIANVSLWHTENKDCREWRGDFLKILSIPIKALMVCILRWIF